MTRFTKIAGTITAADSGGFTAIASTGSLDRDNEILDPGCFSPLPKSVPVHVDHVMTAERAVAVARPYYVGDKLMIDATFAGTKDAQEAREKVISGVVGTVSVAFINARKKEVDGVVHVISGELISVDLVTVPSNRDARVLATRNYKPGPSSARVELARMEIGDALVMLAEIEIAEAKALLRSAPPARRAGPQRRSVNAQLRSIIEAPSYSKRRSL